MSADVIQLSEYRTETGPECDFETAVDVAHRDLREILHNWGSDLARARAIECERMLRHVLGYGRSA